MVFGAVIAGLLSALSAVALIVLNKYRRRLLGYVWCFDLFVSLGFVVTFFGTFSGTVTGFVAGLSFSVLMRAARWAFGSEHLVRRGVTLHWESEDL